MMTRSLGRSGIEVSAIGMGCWAIGGPAWRGDRPIGWSKVDDDESARAIREALDRGVTLFDTADVYGCGHSERVLGKALKDRRDDVVIATKFGNTFDEQTKRAGDPDTSPEYVRTACEASLRRLGTDRIDLYQFHVGNCELGPAAPVRDALEELVSEGRIRAYGWSTDDPERARLFAEGPHCTAVQQALNLFRGNDDTLAVCEQLNLASVNRSPLAMGLLTGKFTSESKLPEDDVRHGWDFSTGDQAEQLEKLEKVRGLLTRDGRTLAQGALGWIWARSDQTIPIPGFKTVEQVIENVGAMDYGPLSDETMAEIAETLGG